MGVRVWYARDAERAARRANDSSKEFARMTTSKQVVKDFLTTHIGMQRVDKRIDLHCLQAARVTHHLPKAVQSLPWSREKVKKALRHARHPLAR